jgi:Flp pilus assembly protein TadB
MAQKPQPLKTPKRIAVTRHMVHVTGPTIPLAVPQRPPSLQPGGGWEVPVFGAAGAAMIVVVVVVVGVAVASTIGASATMLVVVAGSLPAMVMVALVDRVLRGYSYW